MNQLVRKGSAATLKLALPLGSHIPTELAAQLYGEDGTAQWVDEAGDPEPKTLDPEYYELTGTEEYPAGSRELHFDATHARRIPRVGDELFLALGSADPAAQEATPRETVVVVDVRDDVMVLREGTVSAWAVGTRAYQRVVRVALTTDDTATCGRNLRLELLCTFGGLEEEDQTDVVEVLLDVVLHKPQNALGMERLQSSYPNIFARLASNPRESSGGVEAQLRSAFDLVLEDVSRKLPPDQVYSDQQLEPVTIAKLLWLRAVDGSLEPKNPDRETLKSGQLTFYRQTFEEFLGSIRWVDRDEDATPDDGETNQSCVPRVVFDF